MLHKNVRLARFPRLQDRSCRLPASAHSPEGKNHEDSLLGVDLHEMRQRSNQASLLCYKVEGLSFRINTG